MTATPPLRTVVVERQIAFPPERIWRALTQPHLIAEWLMHNDFKLAIGQRFKFSESWGSVDCEVLAIEPNKTLSYKWDAFGLESTVTFTLTPTADGTQLRMEQHGFRPDQDRAFEGARQAWPNYLAKLEQILAAEISKE